MKAAVRLLGGWSKPKRPSPTMEEAAENREAIVYRYVRAGFPLLVLVSGAGALVVEASLTTVTLSTLIILLFLVVFIWPATAAYLIIGLTPLIAGIDRGVLVPLLRPNEVLDLLLGGAVVTRAVLQLTQGRFRWPYFTRLDMSILLMAVTSSILPLAWMAIRSKTIESDDLLYAIGLWKLYGVYILVRWSVRSDKEIRRCIWVSMAAACVVGMISVLQSLNLFGVPSLLADYYSSYGNVEAVLSGRVGSTVGLPIAMADFMILNLALAVGCLLQGWSPRGLLVAVTFVFALATLLSGEVSAAVGLLLAVFVIGWVTYRPRVTLSLVLVTLATLPFLRSVISQRLEGFQGASSLPLSWIGRLDNLRTYFWPHLFSDYQFVLGVRPSARVVVPSQATGYVWIESGYTWLLWSGGIPFLLSFLYFLRMGLGTTLAAARQNGGPVSVVALGATVGLVVIAVLMTVDIHLTYRGSADLFFSLLALTISGRHGEGLSRAVSE